MPSRDAKGVPRSIAGSARDAVTVGHALRCVRRSSLGSAPGGRSRRLGPRLAIGSWTAPAEDLTEFLDSQLAPLELAIDNFRGEQAPSAATRNCQIARYRYLSWKRAIFGRVSETPVCRLFAATEGVLFCDVWRRCNEALSLSRCCYVLVSLCRGILVGATRLKDCIRAMSILRQGATPNSK